MIRNDRQYNVTRGQAAKLRSALEHQRRTQDGMDGRVYQAMVAGIQSQIQELEDELRTYESWRGATVVELQSPGDLGHGLVKARVARGFSQRQLAERLGIAPQQVQRYEATAYQRASLARLVQVIEALEVGLTAELLLKADATPADTTPNLRQSQCPEEPAAIGLLQVTQFVINPLRLEATGVDLNALADALDACGTA